MSENYRVVIRGGNIVDSVTPTRRADVAIENGAIATVGEVESRPGDHVIDATGRLVMPGMVDAHSHTDGLTFDDDIQRSLLRQGVTSVITGQDGVSYAPGDGVYGTEYFAAIDGPHPTYAGGGVAEFLAAVDGRSRVNVAYLVPAGTVRFEVCGRSDQPADAGQVEAMTALVEQGLDEGAVGLSTGLDYVPGMFQDAAEIAALCRPVARLGGVYVSHMRGKYEANSAEGIAEMAEIARLTQASGTPALPVHVSHFHADADIVLGQMDWLAARGVDASFDAYPYIRGCSLLGMPLLPPELSLRTVDEIVATLGDADERQRLRDEWFPQVAKNASLGPGWPTMITLAHLAAPELAWAHGLTIADAAARAGTDPITFTLDALRLCRLNANGVMAVQNERPVSELAKIFSHPAHMGGSDGIFVGAHPHPRARGTFARFLREYVRETGTWTWQDANRHLSSGPAARFKLGRRGGISVGAVADIIVLDPDGVADLATYDEPMHEAKGIDDVLVAGVPVLAGGQLTDALPGVGLRRATP